MNEYITNCPCCGNQLKIHINSGNDAAVFLLEENYITQSKLSKNFGIDIGIVEDKNKDAI